MEAVPLLDLKAQFATLRDEIEAAVRDVIERQAFILGPGVERFESDLAEFVGSTHAIGCASGTDALILSLAALEIGAGDRVLTTPFSFFATASCAYKVGARPAFADIEAETFNLDPEAVAAAITPDVRAILPVHLFGQSAEMDRLMAIAGDKGLAVVEDAAQALSTAYRPGGEGDKRVGTIGSLGCYSFFPSKNLGGFGDGGMIVTSDDDLAARLRLLRVHGGKKMYHHEYVGWNSRLDALQAAVLRVKLPHLDSWSRARDANARRYDRWFEQSGLVESGEIRPPRRTDRSTHIFNQYTVRAERRDELREHLKANGIGHAIYYPVPLHVQECFAELGYRAGEFPVAEQACREVLALPVFPELTQAQQQRVAETVAAFYGKG